MAKWSNHNLSLCLKLTVISHRTTYQTDKWPYYHQPATVLRLFIRTADWYWSCWISL